jgi:hypothetical protein
MPLPGPKRPNFFLKYTNKNTKRHALLHTFVKICGVRNVYTLSTRERGRGGAWGYLVTAFYTTHTPYPVTYTILFRLINLSRSHTQTIHVTLVLFLFAPFTRSLCLFPLSVPPIPIFISINP